MDPVGEDLRLDNGDKTVLLTDTSVASQAIHDLVGGVVGGGVVCHVNTEGRAPLGKLGPRGVVGNTIIVETI